MEMGTGKHLICILLLLHCIALYAETWNTGVLPMDSTSVLSDVGVLISEQYAKQISQILKDSQMRRLTPEEQEFFRVRIFDRWFIEQAKSHHRRTKTENENFLTGKQSARIPFPTAAKEMPVPGSVSVSVKEIPGPVGFSDTLRMYLSTVEYQLEEIIGSSLAPEGGGYRLHIYRYLRDADQADTLLFEYIAPGEILDPALISSSLGMYMEKPGTIAARLLPTDIGEQPLNIRTIPSRTSISGASGLYGVQAPGYSPQYLFYHGQSGIPEISLSPKWADQINPITRRSDQFYRSLAAVMISLPVTFLAYDAVQQGNASQVVFLSCAAVNITATVKTLIDLFRYTNYLQ